MFGPASCFRLGALLAAAAFGVHQLRFLVAYGGDARHALDESGHSYLELVEPLVGLAIAFLVGHLLWRVLLGHTGSKAISRGRLGVFLAAALLVVFTGQELLEGQLAAGHADGLAGVFGAGGWLAVPLCVLAGCGLARLIDLAERIPASGVLVSTRSTRPSLDPTQHGLLLVTATLPRRPLLASHLAGRAPPSALNHE